MSARRRGRPAKPRRRRGGFVLIGAALVVLVVVDVALVGLAIRRTAPTDHGQLGPIPTFSSTPTVPSSAATGGN